MTKTNKGTASWRTEMLNEDHQDHCLYCGDVIPPGPDFCGPECEYKAANHDRVDLIVKAWVDANAPCNCGATEGVRYKLGHSTDCPVYRAKELKDRILALAASSSTKDICETCGGFEKLRKHAPQGKYWRTWDGQCINPFHGRQIIIPHPMFGRVPGKKEKR